MPINFTFEPAEFALLKYAVRRAQFEEDREAGKAVSDLCREGCSHRAKEIAALLKMLDATA